MGNMTDEQIDQMTVREIQRFLDNDGNPEICTVERCLFQTMSGFTLCVGHMYEFPQKANEQLIRAKLLLSKSS